MLDLAMREASHGRASLREVLQWMNANYAKKGHSSPIPTVCASCRNRRHADLGRFLRNMSPEPKKFPGTISSACRFARGTGHPHRARSGFHRLAQFRRPHVVASVTPGSEAERAGLQVGDTILEMRASPSRAGISPATRAPKSRRHADGESPSRRGAERELKWKVGSRQEHSYQLQGSRPGQPSSGRAARLG